MELLVPTMSAVHIPGTLSIGRWSSSVDNLWAQENGLRRIKEFQDRFSRWGTLGMDLLASRLRIKMEGIPVIMITLNCPKEDVVSKVFS